jgi:xylulokinase
MASLWVGRTCPIDTGDGAGMNLMDLESLSFSPALLEATAPELGRRLSGPVPSETRVGELSGYFVRKYGFSLGTPVYAFTGDNPSSLIGMGASSPGTAVVSLGTSDTVFAAMRHPRTDPRGFGHVFGNPAGGFMSLICFANGSLARQRIKDELQMSWDDFSRVILEQTKPGNSGNFMLPYFVPEMTPKVLLPRVERFGTEEFESGKDRPGLVRAVVEAQALSMQRHSDWIGETPTELLVTGGASKNPGIRQVLADVFQATIRTLQVGNSSALGAALRAAHAGSDLSWGELTERFAAPSPEEVKPGPGTASVYGALRKRLASRLDAIAG